MSCISESVVWNVALRIYFMPRWFTSESFWNDCLYVNYWNKRKGQSILGAFLGLGNSYLRTWGYSPMENPLAQIWVGIISSLQYCVNIETWCKQALTYPFCEGSLVCLWGFGRHSTGAISWVVIEAHATSHRSSPRLKAPFSSLKRKRTILL